MALMESTEVVFVPRGERSADLATKNISIEGLVVSVAIGKKRVDLYS